LGDINLIILLPIFVNMMLEKTDRTNLKTLLNSDEKFDVLILVVEQIMNEEVKGLALVLVHH
jgi:hypothetical protein